MRHRETVNTDVEKEKWWNWEERNRKICGRRLNWDGNKYMGGKKGGDSRKNWQSGDRRGEGERTKRVSVIGEQISSTDLMVVTTNMVIITRVRKCNNEPVLSFLSVENCFNHFRTMLRWNIVLKFFIHELSISNSRCW